MSDRPGCLFALLRLILPRQLDAPPPVPADAPRAMPEPSVMVSKRFVSPGERAFLPALRIAVGPKVWVAPQVAINQLLYLKRDCPARRSWQAKMDRRSLDFVLIDPETYRPLAAIELDDRSHDKPDRRKRDAEVGRLCAAAGLPLLRVAAAQAYDPIELRDRLRAARQELGLPVGGRWGVIGDAGTDIAAGGA